MTTIQINPSKDAFNYQSAVNTEYGGWATLLLQNYANTIRNTFIAFDLSVIPAGSTITSVKLLLNYTSGYAGTAYPIFEVYKCLREWVESELNWNVWSVGNNWSTGGGLNSTTDYDGSTLITTFTQNYDPVAGNFITFPTSTNFVSIIQNNIGGEANLLIKVNNSRNVNYTYKSKEDATAANRPYLEIEYILGVMLKYRTGATSELCAAATYAEYTEPFDSGGFVQLRVEG